MLGMFELNGRNLVVVGLLVLLGLGGRESYVLYDRGLGRPEPQDAAIKGGVFAKLGTLEARADQVFKAAQTGIKNCIVSGNRFNMFFSLSKWLSLLLTSLIAIIIGYVSLRRSEEEQSARDSSDRSKTRRKTRQIHLVLGMMSILATLLTSLGFQAVEDAQQRYSDADVLLAAIVKHRSAVLAAPTMADQAAILDELEALTSKLCC